MGQPSEQQQALLYKLAENMRDHPEEWEQGYESMGRIHHLARGKVKVRTAHLDDIHHLKGHASINGQSWGPEHQGLSQALFESVVDRTIEFLDRRDLDRREAGITSTLILEAGIVATVIRSRFAQGFACGTALVAFGMWAFAALKWGY